MKCHYSLRPALFSLCIFIGTAGAMWAQGTNPSPGQAHGQPEQGQSAGVPGNLAVVATATGSGRTDYVITTLNDGLTPTPPGNSRFLRPQQRFAGQWVQYDWKQPISTHQVALF